MAKRFGRLLGQTAFSIFAAAVLQPARGTTPQDLNFVGHSQKYSCGGPLTVLHDHDDWPNLNLPGVARASVVLNNRQGDVVFCDLPIEGAK